MRRWHSWVAVALVVAGVSYLEWRLDRSDHQKIAQGAYDCGKYVGRVLGQCDALAAVAKANPDSEWTAKAGPALEGCKPLVAKHAPGTTEIIKLAPKADR